MYFSSSPCRFTFDIFPLSPALHLSCLLFNEQIPGRGQSFYYHWHVEEVLLVTLTRHVLLGIIYMMQVVKKGSFSSGDYSLEKAVHAYE